MYILQTTNAQKSHEDFVDDLPGNVMGCMNTIIRILKTLLHADHALLCRLFRDLEVLRQLQSKCNCDIAQQKDLNEVWGGVLNVNLA